MNDKYITISYLNKYIKSYLEKDLFLIDIYLKGEISNFKYHTSGHLYFSLKDETSRIKAVMFSRSASKLKFMPVDGMNVLIHGKIGVYEANGEYQIYVDDMIEDGIGNLYIALEQLKDKLGKEGLFDEKYKKDIPKYPKRVGVITASTGAAIKDIISTIKRRYPICEIILLPSLVQGEQAKYEIVKQISNASLYNLDVLIVGRGGGSIEDLWPFNEEIVARAIFDCKIPIISAVGHEIDFTIADFVADLRAPTPTGAAEIAVPNLIDVLNAIKSYQIRLNTSINNLIKEKNKIINNLITSSAMKYPMRLYEVKMQKLDNLVDNLNSITNKIIEAKKNRFIKSYDSYIFKNPNQLYLNKAKDLDRLLEKCEILNPINSLKRGYSITRKDNKVIDSKKQIKIGDMLSLELKDGIIDTKVEGI